MTGENTLPEATARSELLLLLEGPTAPTSRPDPGWEEYAAQFLLLHPEVTNAAPKWTVELEFLNIDDEVDGTVFSCSRTIRDVEIYGTGRLLPGGQVEMYDEGIPNIYIRGELRADQDPDVARWATDVAEDLIAAAALLRAEPRLLRRPAGVDAELQRLDA
ncbi:hypothetical protein [Microbacterium sp.]|uniref:hypothetical protein n=1 Tax=Microbacterium sp. TaxID=51671 RepID=UPI002638D3B2|nr:hypothetical protein [Microbacterium sp.]MCV0334088.1 hypothetical protein [Microbacterium sp.]MCV0374384.1 hypothetical protein [Microbacterium sp.]MCV0389456.1 hypothetical protein [Microbacterium sp.]MCV0418990.1 hypothetical protein [Microbacterium sp.]MCV0421296.1 hypothetical protein [Microbacterium sp.]